MRKMRGLTVAIAFTENVSWGEMIKIDQPGIIKVQIKIFLKLSYIYKLY